MDYIVSLFNKKVLDIEKEIFSYLEDEWIIKFIDFVLDDLENIRDYMVAFSSALSLDDYMELENLVVSISVKKKKNLNKVYFDFDGAYNRIRLVLNSRKEEVLNNLKKVSDLRVIEKKYKTVLLDISLNNAINADTYDFILSSLSDLDIKKRVSVMNGIGFYSSDESRNRDIDEFIGSVDFNLELIPRYENMVIEKRKFIYSIVPDVYKVLTSNGFNDIEGDLCDCFDFYDFGDKEKALFTSLLLDLIYNDLRDYRNSFLSGGFYTDKDSSLEIIDICNCLKNAYNKIKNMYRGYTAVISDCDKRDLSFGYLSNQSNKSRVMDDIEDYLRSNDIDPIQTRYAYNLLKDYVEKSPKVIFEGLNGQDGYYKIKYHSGTRGSGGGKLKKPRYIIHKVNGKFIIIGFFLKNSQRGNKDYNSMCNRSYVLNSDMDRVTTDDILNLLESKINGKKK